MPGLEDGQKFPTLKAPILDGEPIILPDDTEGRWTILLFYRGFW